MEYKEFIENDYFANPNSTDYGTIPKYLEDDLDEIPIIPFDGTRPKWHTSTAKMREYLMHKYWGGNYQSRSKMWVISHDGSPLPEHAIQIDHIFPWNKISALPMFLFVLKTLY
jgi:hypothetical protein